MKKLVLLSAIAISGLFYNTANAQFRVHLGINLFPNRVVLAPRADVPVYADADYNANDDYYYLPDVDAYYNINQQCYYYFDGDNWISAAFLPGEYHDFDWRNARRYEVREPRPYLRNNFYMNRYRGNEYAFNRGDFHGGFDNHDYRQQYDDNRNYARFDDHQYQNNWDHNQQQGRVNENYGWNNNRGNQESAQRQDQDRNMWNNGGNRNNNHQQQTEQNQRNQNHNDGGRGNEQRIAQNNQNHGGHGGGGWNRF